MKLTQEINQALERIQQEDHTVHTGIRDALFDAVGPIYDEEKSFFPLRPSSCLKPLRDLFYDLKNYYAPGSIPKAPFEARIKLIFQFGHMTETVLKKLFAYKYGVVFEQERVKYGQLTDKDGNVIELTGSIDWASYLGGKALVLCDAKSIGDYPFKTAPKVENIAQMQLYMHSDWGRANQVDRALLIYFNKNTSDIKVIEVPYDAKLAAKLFQRLELVYEYYKRDELPPREYVSGCDWQADYSSYKDHDNAEFMPNVVRQEVLSGDNGPDRTGKPELRHHVEKYGNKVVSYVDKTVKAEYINGKLNLVIKEI